MYFFIQINGIHIPMHHPRDMGPPPLRNVSDGLQCGPPEPPCGLQPRASPMIFPYQRIPGTQNQYQTSKIMISPHFFVTVNPPPQIQKNAGSQDRTVRRTAAQQRLPINWHALAHCLNRLPSTFGPANFPLSLIQRLIISFLESRCPLKPIA